MAKERTTIQVDTETLRTFRDACDAMPQSPKMSRVAIGLCRWFSRRTELVKSAVISGIDEGMEHIYAKALRETADELERRAPKLAGVIRQKEPAGKRLAKPADALQR